MAEDRARVSAATVLATARFILWERQESKLTQERVFSRIPTSAAITNQALWAPPRRAVPGPPELLAVTKVIEYGSRDQIVIFWLQEPFKYLQTS